MSSTQNSAWLRVSLHKVWNNSIISCGFLGGTDEVIQGKVHEDRFCCHILGTGVLVYFLENASWHDFWREIRYRTAIFLFFIFYFCTATFNSEISLLEIFPREKSQMFAKYLYKNVFFNPNVLGKVYKWIMAPSSILHSLVLPLEWVGQICTKISKWQRCSSVCDRDRLGVH